MKIRTLPLLCVSLLALAPGCKKIASEVMNRATGEVSNAVSGPSAEEEAMGLYAKGFNVLIDDPQDCLDEYFGDVPAEGPEAGKKYNLFPRHSTAEPKLADVKTAFAEGAKKAPAELKHLEALATDAVKHIVGVVSTFKDAHKYYDSETFKDDQGKVGKELHDKLVAGAKAYRESVSKLEDALSAIEEKQLAAELAKFADEKGYSYWFRNMQAEANRVLKTTDAAKFGPAYARFEKARTDFAAFVSGKGAEVNKAFQGYSTQVESFDSHAKKMDRAARDVAKPEELGNLRSQLVSYYNNMVSVSNSLRELEANNLLK